MILGIFYWPLAAADCLDALKKQHTRRVAVLSGAAGGVAAGLGSPSGGQYATVFALLLLLGRLWSERAGPLPSVV